MGKEGEVACAQCFMQWYSSRHGLVYDNPIKAEEVFPELKDKKNWDFVAIPKSGSNDKRLALEVKSVIRPNTRIQRSQWEQIFRSVSKNLQITTVGTFDVYTHVNLNPTKSTKFKVLRINHAEQPKFVSLLTDIISKSVLKMKLYERKDLGPEILSAFRLWPVQYIRDSPVACDLYLLKSSNAGHSIRFSSSGISGGSEEKAIIESLESLDMTTQLGLARSKGFQQTVLLLDLDSLLSWDPEAFRKWLIDIKFSAHDISCVYLVKVSGSKVAEVWTA